MQPKTISDLPCSGNAFGCEGTHYSGVPASLILFAGPPGSGPRLHRHPYAELFVIEVGEATFVVGSEFLHSTDIHLSDHFTTEWLEQPARD
jgi:hypothetical protein